MVLKDLQLLLKEIAELRSQLEAEYINDLISDRLLLLSTQLDECIVGYTRVQRGAQA
jgi:hypothetical protein